MNKYPKIHSNEIQINSDDHYIANVLKLKPEHIVGIDLYKKDIVTTAEGEIIPHEQVIGEKIVDFEFRVILSKDNCYFNEPIYFGFTLYTNIYYQNELGNNKTNANYSFLFNLNTLCNSILYGGPIKLYKTNKVPEHIEKMFNRKNDNIRMVVENDNIYFKDDKIIFGILSFVKVEALNYI